MGLMDRIKKVTGNNDGYDDSYDDDYYDGFDNYEDEGDDSDVQFVPPTGQSQTQTQNNVNMYCNRRRNQLHRREYQDAGRSSSVL